jgi:hypothetical protein
VGPEGLEPSTYGLKGQTDPEGSPIDKPSRGPIVGHERLFKLAVEFARAARGGDRPAHQLAVDLALAVGEAMEPGNRLVAAALAGGPPSVPMSVRQPPPESFL